MIKTAVAILKDNRLASLATTRLDGWPHCTMVGIANEDLRIYFVVSRTSEKLVDIMNDDRVSLAVGRDVIDPASIKALSISARASEISDDKERRRVVRLLLEKRPALDKLEAPRLERSAVMIAMPEVIRLLDYSKGYGHSILLKLGKDGHLLGAEEQQHDWGYGDTIKPVI
jgi:nitroimidazol reductase NimA-like FMN-containing flavoprotein (pyridoxamine 5'-phosphate oxidase superfamily)